MQQLRCHCGGKAARGFCKTHAALAGNISRLPAFTANSLVQTEYNVHTLVSIWQRFLAVNHPSIAPPMINRKTEGTDGDVSVKPRHRVFFFYLANIKQT